MKEDFHHLGSIKILPKGLDLDNNYETAERHYRHMNVLWEQYKSIRAKLPDVIYHIIDRGKHVLGDNEIPKPNAKYPTVAIAGPDEKNNYTLLDLTDGHIIPLMKFDNPVDAMHMMQLYNTREKESKRLQLIQDIVESIAQDKGENIHKLIIGIIAIKYRDALELQKFYEIISDFNVAMKMNENSGILYVQKLIDYLATIHRQPSGRLRIIVENYIAIAETVLEMLRIIKRFQESDSRYTAAMISYANNINQIL